MEDTPKTAQRRIREKRTISHMICLHCAETCEPSTRTEQAHCGELVCPSCKALDDYAVLRTERCRNMEVKTSCEECGNHCYNPTMKEQIRTVMRYAGPRMLKTHPIAAIRHLIGK